MTSRAGKTIEYDYDNRATRIVYGASTVDNIYDYTGQRVKKVTATATTLYIGKLYEITNGAITRYIFAGSQRIASKTGSTTLYYHTDHLGSTGIVTNQAGTKVKTIYYYPFGEVRAISGTANVRYKYTGQEEDAETGLYYYGARYYDPALGRFISADTIVQEPDDPQTLNRYSYCGNNPIIYTDPSGHLFGIDDLTIGILLTGMLKGAAIGSAIGGGVAAATGSDVGMGMLTGAIGGAIFGGAGAAVHGMEAAGNVASITKAGIHAGAGVVSGGINAGISGENIGMGMLAGGLGAGIAAYVGAEYLPKNDAVQAGGRVLLGGAIGGAVSTAYGGSFGSGFIQGGMASLFGELLNDMMSKNRIDEGQIDPDLYLRQNRLDPNAEFKPENDLVKVKLTRTILLHDKSLSLNTGKVSPGHSTGLASLSVDATIGSEGSFEAGIGLRNLGVGLNFSSGGIVGISFHFGFGVPSNLINFSTSK